MARRRAAAARGAAHLTDLAVELVRGEGKEPAPELVQQICAEALARGLVVIRCGLYGNCLRLLPPLDIPNAELDEGLAVLEAPFGAVLQEQGAVAAS